MKTLISIAIAAAFIATPAVAQYGGNIYDASRETGNTRKSPDIQGKNQGKLQTGSGQESGGYARERLRR